MQVISLVQSISLIILDSTVLDFNTVIAHDKLSMKQLNIPSLLVLKQCFQMNS